MSGSRSALSHAAKSLFAYFSAPDTSHAPDALLTSSRDLLGPVEYPHTVAWSLVPCRSKSHANRKPQKSASARRPPFAPGALEELSTVRLKANNVPTAQVHILSGSAASPQSPAIFRGGKGLSYTRAGRPLCEPVIHVELRAHG